MNDERGTTTAQAVGHDCVVPNHGMRHGAAVPYTKNSSRFHRSSFIVHRSMTRPEYLVIITGLSGSGKSYVQSTLEDLGFYCCDNLPIELIEPFLEEVASHEKATRVGIVVDVRTHDFATIFPNFYRERIQKLVPNVVLIFLEATDEVLARRYSETRRPRKLPRRPRTTSLWPGRSA